IAQHHALVDARYADHLLRRRNRYGRQFLPWRSKWLPHADAMEPGSQRRFFQGKPATASSPDHHRPGISLRSDQRRESAEKFVLIALVDAPRHRDAQKLQSFFPRLARISLSG